MNEKEKKVLAQSIYREILDSENRINEIQKKYPNKIVLVGLQESGDYNGYVALNEPAQILSETLHFKYPLVRIQHLLVAYIYQYSVDTILPDIVKAGHSVAICDALQSPCLNQDEFLRKKIIQSILSNQWWRDERKIAAELLNDLRQCRELEKWLYYGKTATQIIRNYDTYLKGIPFGFGLEDVSLNEHGWYEIMLIDREEIEFKTGKTSFNQRVAVSKGKNETFVYGVYYSFGGSGGSDGGSIYSTAYPSRKEALIAGLDKLVHYHLNFILNPNEPDYLKSLVRKSLENIRKERIRVLFDKPKQQVKVLSLFE
jgi:hypothetical protein